MVGSDSMYSPRWTDIQRNNSIRNSRAYKSRTKLGILPTLTPILRGISPIIMLSFPFERTARFSSKDVLVHRTFGHGHFIRHEAYFGSTDLDLGHAGTGGTSRSSPTTRTDTASTGLAEHDKREDRGDRVSKPGKPEEGHGSLGFTASLLAVFRAIGDFVVTRVVLQKLASLLSTPDRRVGEGLHRWCRKSIPDVPPMQWPRQRRKWRSRRPGRS